MSTFTDQAAAVEEKADKWFLRLKRDTPTIIIALLISGIIWQQIREDRKDKTHREDINSLNLTIKQKDAEIAELNREAKAAYMDAARANSQTTQVLMWGKVKSQDSSGR